MVPRIIIRQLARLRWRERALRLVWGATLGVTVLAAVMAVLCLVDWFIDRRQETPLAVRQAMLIGQVVLWALALTGLLVWAFMRRLSDTDLALYVEDREPQFCHRLISALQLNQAGANVEGMSPAMIAAATREAEQQAGKHDFARLADHSRLERATKLGLVAAAVVAVFLLFWFETVAALVARQFLANREIPRSVALASVTEKVWPSGEEVVLRFRVHGKELRQDLQGEVRIEPETIAADKIVPPAEYYPLVFESQATPGEAIFAARIRPSTVSYNYRAWLVDGRTRQEYRLQLEPRPAIVKHDAWVRMPNYTGLRANGQPYELLQPRGDIVGLPGTSARIAIQTQKPVEKATLELLGRPAHELLAVLPGPWAEAPGLPFAGLCSWTAPMLILSDGGNTETLALRLGRETVLRRVEMRLDDGKQQAEGIFDLRPGETMYRIVVEDEYKFVNLDPPRRTIKLETEEPPNVALLPERFPEPGRLASDDDEVEGVPVLHKGKFRIAYTASTPYGLGKSQFRYRINEGEWWTLPLRDVHNTPETGPFDLRQGAFVNSGFLSEVEFHKMPSADADRFPPGTEGGGRFDFKTAALDDLKVGDKIEFYLEVFDRNPAEGRQPGRSETRQKTVVSLDQYLAWKDQVQQEESRIRQLENKQRGVFTAANPADDGPLVKPLTEPKDKAPRPSPLVRPATGSAFVRDWQIIGPFANTADGSGFDKAYPPETEKVELRTPYRGIKGDVRWRIHRGTADKIDLEKFLEHSDAGVAYAVCWFHTVHARALLSTGSDDGIKVWIDRKEFLAKKSRRDAVAGEDKTPVTWRLDEEWHELLVKVDNRTGSWAFFLELFDPNTLKPIHDLRFRVTPPGSEETQRFVREWQLIGPFANEGESGRDKSWPPETDKIDVDKEYDSLAGKVKWKLHKSETGRIGLDKFFDRPFNESNLAYAVCWVRSDKARSATLATGSDDGIKVWINRKLRIDAAVHRDAEPGKDVQKIELKEGWNEILVKVDNRFGRWAFYLELRDPDLDRPLEGIEFSTALPKD